MKSFVAVSIAVVSTVSAHSWLECTNHDNSQLKGWMQGNSTLSPPVIVDPAMPWFASYCKGWPRAKHNPGNWIDESTNYVWNLAANAFNGEKHACPPGQRSPTYDSNAPMASAAPGDSFKLRFGGNGHSRGDNVGGDPGTVTVYWKGKPETEITDVSEFTDANKLVSGGFAADAFNYPADPNVKSPVQGLVDKGNWLNVKIPADAPAGRHMMVWVWSYKNAPQWSTCFDVQVGGSNTGPANTSSGKSSSAPASSGSASAPASGSANAPASSAAPTGTANSPAAPIPSPGSKHAEPEPLPAPAAPAAAAAPSAAAAPAPAYSPEAAPSAPAAPPAPAAPAAPSAPVAPAASGGGEHHRGAKACKSRKQRRGHARAF